MQHIGEKNVGKRVSRPLPGAPPAPPRDGGMKES